MLPYNNDVGNNATPLTLSMLISYDGKDSKRAIVVQLLIDRPTSSLKVRQCGSVQGLVRVAIFCICDIILLIQSGSAIK